MKNTKNEIKLFEDKKVRSIWDENQEQWYFSIVELTDEWKRVGLKQGGQFATLTDIITKSWSGKNVKEYKVLKGLKKENLRDNITLS